jgi:hypothetical protein
MQCATVFMRATRQPSSRRSLNLRTPNIRAQDAKNDVTLGKSGVVATSRGGAAT